MPTSSPPSAINFRATGFPAFGFSLGYRMQPWLVTEAYGVFDAEVGRAVREIKAKIVIHCGGLTPYISLARMQELGIALTILPGLACEGAVARAVYDAGLLVKQHGIEGYRQVLESVKGHPMEDFNEFIGFGTVREIEGKYLPPEDTAKYEGSIGYTPTSAAPGRPRESA
jgi:hypothetical protein